MGERKTIWNQFVERRAEWIGGILEEMESGFPETSQAVTTITDICLEPNGGSLFFWVKGEDFNCGFDVGHGGVGAGEDGWITFYGFGGHKWRIKKKEDRDDELQDGG